MRDLRKRIEELQSQLKKHRQTGLKEYLTRTIFFDPLLSTLGWDVRDPDEVELEYPTIDGKAVDYALKINKKVVALIEAKALNDPLDDVKSITQVVGYAANNGVEWCVLTNGVRYMVYSSSQKATAPNKLLFEVSIDPVGAMKLSSDQIASLLNRLSRGSMAQGVLDQLGEEIFTNAKGRKALDKLVAEQDESLVRLIRKTLGDDTIAPAQIRSALPRVWGSEDLHREIKSRAVAKRSGRRSTSLKTREQFDYGETRHTADKPVEVVELYRALDRLCQDFAPGHVVRRHLKKHIAWAQDKNIFCTVHLLQSGLRVWLKIDPSEVPPSVSYARDVSHVGHWGVGDIELAIDNMETLRNAESLILASYEAETQRNRGTS